MLHALLNPNHSYSLCIFCVSNSPCLVMPAGQFKAIHAIFAPSAISHSKQANGQNVLKRSTCIKQTKPFFVQSFTYFARHVYFAFFLYSGLILFGSSHGIACDRNGGEANEMAEFLCLMEEGYTVRGSTLAAGSYSPRYAHFTQDRARLTGEVFPSVSGRNQSVSFQYRFYRTFVWIDLLIFLQMIIFILPETLWDRLRWDKEASIFERLNWNIPDTYEYHLNTEKVRKMIRLLKERQEEEERRKEELCKIEVPLSPEGKDKQKDFEQIESVTELVDPEMAQLFAVARSNFAANLALVLLAQFACILLMTSAFDLVLDNGSGPYQFTTFGVKMFLYWANYWINGEEEGKSMEYPAEVILPLAVKCQYSSVGPGGSVMREDYLCLIGSNYLLSKLLWFTWTYYLLTIGALFYVLIGDLLLLSLPSYRRQYIASLLDDRQLSRKLLKFEKACNKESVVIPEHHEVPYQVAVFAIYLIRNLGHFRARAVLKKFTYAYAHRSKVLTLEKLAEKLEELEKKANPEAKDGHSGVISDSLYEHYLNFYRRDRNQAASRSKSDVLPKLWSRRNIVTRKTKTHKLIADEALKTEPSDELQFTDIRLKSSGNDQLSSEMPSGSSLARHNSIFSISGSLNNGETATLTATAIIHGESPSLCPERQSLLSGPSLCTSMYSLVTNDSTDLESIKSFQSVFYNGEE